MQQVSYTADMTLSAMTRVLADAALAYLTPPADTFTTVSTRSPSEAVPATTSPIVIAGPKDASELQIKAEIEKPHVPLPSLLQYVDHVLMRDNDRHNRPPRSAQKCIRCNIQWDRVIIPSTFLSLSPCGHWIHYRCLIELAIYDGSSHEGTCCACNTPLFEWDGINTLTLAVRTNLPINNEHVAMINTDTHKPIITGESDYELECDFIDKTIERRFFTQLTKPSSFSDNSPDLIQCFNNALNDFRLLGRPTSKWLTWKTTTGSLLFGMLVAIKMQRFLVENHGTIMYTEAWAAWGQGFRALQARILEDVHQG